MGSLVLQYGVIPPIVVVNMGCFLGNMGYLSTQYGVSPHIGRV